MEKILFAIACLFTGAAITIAALCGHPVLGVFISMWAVLEIKDIVYKD